MSLNSKYLVIDADGHVTEPVDHPDAILYGQPGHPDSRSTLFGDYVDPAFRDELPVLYVDADGKTRMRLEGKILGTRNGFGGIGMLGLSPEEGKTLHETRYGSGHAGGFDPKARVEALDLDGIDMAALYPTLGLMTDGIEDPNLVAALARAYNRWLADYCSVYPDRLIGVAMLPMQSVELAIKEMRYVRNELGMSSGFVRPNAYNGRFLGDAEYDPLWATAAELDFAIGIHEGTGSGGMPAAGIGHVRGLTAEHIVSHTFEIMVSCVQIIWGGVCERFPTVRFAFLESGGGWVASWLDRMDRHYHSPYFQQNEDCSLSLAPSEYFKRQCWISIEPIEQTIAAVAEYVGGDHVLWATDYPHSDGFFPGAPQMIEQRLPEHLLAPVMGQGAVEFYKLS